MQPLFTMIVFSVLFGRLASIPSDNVPYPVFAFTALLPWQLFVHGLTESSNSLVGNQTLLTKVYFPRLLMPLAPVFAGVVDFSVAMTILFGLMIYYGISATGQVFTIPFFFALALATTFGAGLWLSALNVKFRDVRYTLPFLNQLWLFVTPVAYPVSLIPGRWRIVYGLNPMVGVVEGFRWALLGTPGLDAKTFAASSFGAFTLLIGGLYYFRRMERTFADVA